MGSTSIGLLQQLPKYDFYYTNSAIERWLNKKQNRTVKAVAKSEDGKLRRPHIDRDEEEQARYRDDAPSLNVIQPPRWHLRGKPAEEWGYDYLRMLEEQCRDEAYGSLRGAGGGMRLSSRILMDDFFTDVHVQNVPVPAQLHAAQAQAMSLLAIHTGSTLWTQEPPTTQCLWIL